MAHLSGSTPICWWIQFPIEMAEWGFLPIIRAMGIEKVLPLEAAANGFFAPKKRIGSAKHVILIRF